MTNLRKSYVPVFAVLALAFCIIMIGQAMADSRKLELIRSTEDNFGVPLPSQEVLVGKKAFKVASPSIVQMEGDQPATRPAPSKAAASTEGGGDTYATATVIAVVPYADAGTTVGATYDYDSPLACVGGGGGYGCPDVVYSYTPAFSGILTVSTCELAVAGDADTRMWLVDGGTMATIACNDDDCATWQSGFNASVTGGTTYYIVIGGYSAGDAGTYHLSVALTIPGTACTAPLPITYPAAESLLVHPYAVDLGISPCPSGTLFDAYGYLSQAFIYEFTAPINGLYHFSWCDDNAVKPITRYTAIGQPVCGLGFIKFVRSAETMVCSDDGPYVMDLVMVGGTTTLVEVMSRLCQTPALKGTLTVTWDPLPLLNDDCADAEDLGTGATGDVFGHNLGATLDGPGIDGCSPADPSEVCADVWYVWTADATGYARFDMCVGETDNKLWVYRGVNCAAVTAGTQEAVGCSDDGCDVGGGPGFTEVPCTIGEQFLVRIAGWYIAGDPTYGDCNAYGMGVFYINCEVFPSSIRPAMDSCKTAVPVLLADSVMVTQSGTTFWAGWDCIPHSVDYPETNTWHAFSINTCANVITSNCGIPTAWGYGPSRYSTSSYLFAPIYTGCDCQGPVVRIYAAVRGGTVSGGARCTFFGFPADQRVTKWYQFNSLIPGDYYVVVHTFYVGIVADGANWNYFIDYYLNFLKTAIPCVYCPATGNVASCPPVAGATWIDRASISGMNNPGPSGCHGYQDFTLLPGGKVYRGFTYNLSVGFGIQGLVSFFDATYRGHAYFDWNQNSGLTANQNELGEAYTLTRVGPNLTAAILIPDTAALLGQGATGQTRLRLRINLQTEGSIPCGSNTWGEVEDYTVQVYDLECGDFNIDGTLDGTDIAYLEAFYFGTGPAPDIWQRGDVDGDGAITIADIIALVDAAYHSGALNCHP